MRVRLRKVWILALACLLLVGLISGVYAAKSNPTQVTQGKDKSPKQALGKNWEIKGSIKLKGKPNPKKNLIDTSDPTSDHAVIDKRPRPSHSGPDGSSN